MKLNVLYFNDAFYQFPPGIRTLDAFVQALEACRARFVHLVRFDCDNCVYPYFIAEDMREVYVSIQQIIEIEEDIIYVLPRAEYDRRLAACLREHCADCAHFEGEWSPEAIAAHRTKMCLNGECSWKEPI